MRTITEILKEADATKDLQGLINLWNEIANNKRQYPLTEIWFANEHIRKLALKSNGEDIDKGKFYLELKSQCQGVYLVKKGKKFMKGHGYSTLNGYKFNWTFDKNEARKMDYSTANSLATSSGGSVLHFA